MTNSRLWFTRVLRTGLSAAAFVSLVSLSPLAAAPDQASPIARLKAGNDHYVTGAQSDAPLGSATRQALTKEQHPFAMVLSCADSRVPPEYIFNVGLGDLFVVRAAGEVVDRSVMASLEYGAEHLHIPLLVVMGHESCGAVKTAVEAEHGEGPNLEYLVSHIRAGILHSPGEQKELRGAILANVEQVINDAMSGSQILRQAATSGHLQVVGAYYELGSGHVVFSEPVGTTAAAHK